jgi:ribosomal protein S18 acetylase RimI-like enzyme
MLRRPAARMIDIRRLDRRADAAWEQGSLTRAWGSTSVARGGELLDAMAFDGFVAIEAGEPIGLLTYADRAGDIEVVTLHTEQQGRGAGRALMDAAWAHVRSTGARRLWLSTTNDNLRAIGFYQRWGMDLVELRRDGVTASRAVKASIPHVANGIPLRHELVFERRPE